MNLELHDKVALVTGASKGIGRAVALGLAAEGARVAVVARDGGLLDKVAAECRDRSHKDAVAVAADLSRLEEIERTIREVKDRLGRVDILVNNAANNPKVETPGQSFSRLERFPDEQWDADLAVGLKGPFLCAKIVGGALAAQKRGVIINISSEYGIIAPDQRLYRKQELAADEQPVKPVTYSVVKAGLHGLTLYLATYWAQSGVRVNTISLGGVESGQHDAFMERAVAKIPMGRMAQPHDFQGALVYLCSDAAAFVTGANLVVDGGKTIW